MQPQEFDISGKQIVIEWGKNSPHITPQQGLSAGYTFDLPLHLPPSNLSGQRPPTITSCDIEAVQMHNDFGSA